MQKHLILSILLAFGLVAMCAPAVNPVRRNCARRSPSLSKSSTGGISRAPRKPVARTTRPQSHRIGRRSQDIRLCGIKFRTTSSQRCVGNPGFVLGTGKNKNEQGMQWKEWGQFTAPGNNGCEHIVELRLVKAALESINFCEAWNGMLDVAKNAGHVQIPQSTKIELFSRLKNAANDPEGLHYLDKVVNNEKTAFVGNVIRNKGRIRMTLPIGSDVVAYIKHLAPIGDHIAAKIDIAARQTLNDLYNIATSQYIPGTTEDAICSYADDLMEARENAMGLDDEITVVTEYWQYLRDST